MARPEFMRSRVTFRLFSDVIESSAITERLMLSPTKAGDRGSLVSRALPNGPLRTSTFWALSSGLSDDKPLSDHAHRLIDLLEQRTQLIISLSKECRVSFRCGLFADDNFSTEASLDADIIKWCAEVGVAFHFSCYHYINPKMGPLDNRFFDRDFDYTVAFLHSPLDGSVVLSTRTSGVIASDTEPLPYPVPGPGVVISDLPQTATYKLHIDRVLSLFGQITLHEASCELVLLRSSVYFQRALTLESEALKRLAKIKAGVKIGLYTSPAILRHRSKVN
jgi:hypothetical protein